jgi:hypothetical protein
MEEYNDDSVETSWAGLSVVTVVIIHGFLIVGGRGAFNDLTLLYDMEQ